MDIQTKEALIAEIERFKTESLKTHIVQVWAESYANTGPFSYVILEKENNKVWWIKTQAYQLWKMWKAAQAVPEGFVLVPKEPTQEMIQAGLEKVRESWDDAPPGGFNSFTWGDMVATWEAMIEVQESTND